MSTISDECRLSFYEEIMPLKVSRQFFLVRHRQSGKFFVKKRLSSAHREVYHAIQGITSKNLPRIYECISLENEFIVIEEFINGDTLGELVQQDKMNPMYAADIMTDICNVLFILHSMQPPVIHRDIKPENIMVSNDGVVKLMDFDIARTYDRNKNRDTEYMGTAGYAAPEHFGFGQTDARSDIYSCGVVFNYLLTGQMPEEELANGAFGNIVKKCIQLSPAHRYQNVFELRQALKECLGNNTGYLAESAVSAGTYNSTQTAVNNIPDFMDNAPETPVYAKKWQRFLPPGFRTLKLWKMIVAIVCYGLVIDITVTTDFTSKSATELILTRIFCGIGLLGGILILFNYLGVADKLPWVARSSKKVSCVLRCIYAVITFILVICVLGILLDMMQLIVTIHG